MRVWFLTLLSALSLCALATSGAIADPPVGRVLSVKVGGEGSATRVVVESDIALKYHVFVLAAGTHRVVIDLPRVRWSINGLTSESGSGKGSGLVAG